MRHFFLLTTFLFIVVSAQAESTPNVALSNPDGAQIKIVVASANGDNSYVTDKRVITLVAGRNLVRFFGVPASLDDDSVQPLIAPLNATAGAVEVLQQRFRPIIKATQIGMLRRAIGQTVTVLRENNAPPIKGVLLTTDEVVLLDTPDGVVVNPQGTFVVPRPGNAPGERETFSTVPVLEWVVEAPAAGQYSFEARYQMTGLSWSASYRASLAAANVASRLSLYGWLNLKNESSMDFRSAQIFLFNADDLKLPQLVDLPRGEEKQISFLRVKDLPVARESVFWPTRNGEFLKNFDNLRLETVFRIKNAPENQLGTALPAGVLTIWNVNNEGALQRLVQQKIAYTAPGKTLWIPLGIESGYSGDRAVVASRQLNPVTKEHTLQITLKNYSEQGAAVVIETLPYRAKITEAKLNDADIKPIFLDDDKVQFTIPVAAGEQAVLKYVVEVKSQ